jgi:SAM-dependent methyltransferase
MLGLARRRSGYQRLTQARLGDPLPWADGHFAAVFSTGVFTAGHAPPSSLDEMVRITRRGGKVIFTVRDTVLEDGGFRATFDRLEGEGRWRRVEESSPFRAFAVAEPDVLVQAFVFEATPTP